jgi:CRISPR/Cas system CMR-associated protein Cmr5 small subunit
MFKYITTIVVITALGILFEKFKMKYMLDGELNNNDLINKYLLGETNDLNNKPILWVHSSHITNARSWESFGSRNTKRINQPYLNLCVKTIIKHCGDSFKIALIDDNTFNTLLPKWTIKLDTLSEPIKEHIRTLALFKLIYNYGGFLIPDSTIVMQNLSDIYYNGVKETGCFVGSKKSKSKNYEYLSTEPNSKFIGSVKKCNNIKSIINEIEILVGTNYTNEIEFSGRIENILNKYIKNKNIAYLDCKITGGEDINAKCVTIERLMSSTFMDFSKHTKCIVLPKKEILQRTQYEWFSRLSEKQIYECNTMIAKWLVISLGDNKSCK